MTFDLKDHHRLCHLSESEVHCSGNNAEKWNSLSSAQRPRLAGRHRHRWQRPRHRQQRCDTGLVGKGFLKAAASSAATAIAFHHYIYFGYDDM